MASRIVSLKANSKTQKTQESAEEKITLETVLSYAQQGRTADALKEAAERISQLSDLLFNGQDRGTPSDQDRPEVQYLWKVTQGVNILLDAIALDIVHLAEYVQRSSAMAWKYKQQLAGKGGAE